MPVWLEVMELFRSQLVIVIGSELVFVMVRISSEGSVLLLVASRRMSPLYCDVFAACISSAAS